MLLTALDEHRASAQLSDGIFTVLIGLLQQELPVEYAVEVDPAYPEPPGSEAFVIGRDTVVVQTLVEVSGEAVRPFGPTTEASYLALYAPTVVFGPGELSDVDGLVPHNN